MTESEWLRSDDPRRMLAVLDMREETEGSAAPKAWKVSDRKFRLFACACCRAVWDRFSGPCRQAVETAERYADGGLPFSVLNEARRQTGGGDSGWVWCATNGDIGVGLRNTAYYAVQVPTPSHARPTPSPSEMADILRDIVGNPFRPIPYVWLNEQLDPRPERERLIGDDISDLTPVSWLTPQVLSLAQAAYEEQQENGTLDPFRLLLLADALEDAGCPSEVYSIEKIKAGYSCPLCGDAGFWRGGQEFDHMKKCRKRECGTAWVPEENMVVKTSQPHPLLTHLRSPGPHYRGCHVVDTLLGKA